MSISRVHTWSAGEVLTAADLNAEFSNIINNGSDLVSPFTKAISLGGFALNFDAANTIALTATTSGIVLTGGTIREPTEDTLTAFATGGQTNATALSVAKKYHRISVCATAADSVKLPTSTAGQAHYIRNDGAAAAQVFGTTPDTINGVATGTGVSLAVASGNWYVCTTAGNWTTTTGATLGANAFTGAQTVNATSAFNESKTTVSSATTPDIWTNTGNVIDYTGTTTATGFAAAPQAGTRRTLVCAGAAVFTAGANMIIQGYASGSNYTAAAGDIADVVAITTTQFRLTIRLANGEPVVVPGTGICEGRLTLTSGTAVTTANVTAATTVYFSPFKGSRIATFDGTSWHVSTFTEKSVAVPATTVTPFDVFIVDGTLALETVNWTNDTTRATAIALQNGVYVKSGTTTRRYLGTCRTTGVSGQTEDSTANRFVWNNHNRILRDTLTTYTADRSTTSSSFTELNTEIRPGVVIGVAEDSVFASTVGSGTNASNGNAFTAGVAFDSTSAVDAGFESVVFNNGASMDSPVAISGLKVGLAVGFHYATILVRSPNGTNTVTLRGVTGNGSAKVYLHLGLWG